MSVFVIVNGVGALRGVTKSGEEFLVSELNI